MDLENVIPAEHPPNAGKKNYCFGSLGHLLPLLASVVQGLSWSLCAGQPAVLVLADATVEVLQQVLLPFFFFNLLVFCCSLLSKKTYLGTEISVFGLKKYIIEGARKSDNSNRFQSF